MWNKATLADFIGVRVVYRNLEPMQAGLLGLRQVWAEVGLDHYYVPRKIAPEYAAVLWRYLQDAQRLRGVTAPLKRMLFVGDTLYNDGTAARNIGQYLPWLAFIGADKLGQPAKTEIQGELMVANRWQALADFLAWTKESGFPVDESTVLLLDFDKTCIGARGRNDKVIDAARRQAILATMLAALGEHFDETLFRSVYDAIDQPDYHYFTGDNQDYVAYVCLMVTAGVYERDSLWRDLKSGDIANMEQFVARCQEAYPRMSAALAAAQDQVRQGMAIEDPTPFKDFRRREFLETVGRMDAAPDETDEQKVLTSEIVITAEVMSVARAFRQQGALVFGLSDKPDEASLPTAEGATRGLQPLHRTRMKLYGAPIL